MAPRLRLLQNARLCALEFDPVVTRHAGVEAVTCTLRAAGCVQRETLRLVATFDSIQPRRAVVRRAWPGRGKDGDGADAASATAAEPEWVVLRVGDDGNTIGEVVCSSAVGASVSDEASPAAGKVAHPPVVPVLRQGLLDARQELWSKDRGLVTPPPSPQSVLLPTLPAAVFTVGTAASLVVGAVGVQVARALLSESHEL